MGFVLLDYFKCEPSELNFRFLVANGFWPLDTKIKWMQILYSIYSYICWFSIISMLFIQVLDIYLLRNDPLKLVTNLCATCITIGSIAKYLTIFFKIEPVISLHKQLKHFKNSVTDPEDVKILKDGEDQILKVTKLFYGMSIPCVLAWMLYPGLESSNEKRIPFPYRLPIDEKVTPVYEILYTYQSFSMIGFLVNILSNDLVFYGFIIQISAEYAILIKNFKKIEDITRFKRNVQSEFNNNSYIVQNNRETCDIIHNAIKDNVKFHQVIINEIRQLQFIYSYASLIHFSGVVVLVGFLVVDFVVLSQGFKLLILQRLTYALCGLFDTFLLCLFGNKLQDQGVKLLRTIYSMPWYEMCPKIRKEILMTLMRATQSPKLKAGNIFSLNLRAFLQFLKITYNTTALLYQVVGK